MTDQQLPRVLTPHLAAEVARVHVSTIRRWVADGTLEGQRVGPRLIRIDREALLALVGAR